MNRIGLRLVLAVGAACALGYASDVRAQAKLVHPPIKAEGILRIRALTGDGQRGLIRTPEYNTTLSRGRNAAREWAELAVTFDSEPDWIDELTFQYYALLYDKSSADPERTFALLKGTVTVLDVARGRNHVAAAYIRPSTLARRGQVVVVAVEIVHKGDVVATVSEGKLPKGQALPPEWWKALKLAPVDGLIMTRSQTPFAFVNYDDYEVSK